MERLRAENEALRNEIAYLKRRIAHLERRAAPPRRGAEEGLADESYFLRRLKEAVYSAERYARFLCVVMIDLPNEDRAEGDGDRVLEAASRFAGIFRKTDLVALFDSDRVYVLLEETETSQGIEALKRVQDEIGAILAPRYSMACYPNDAQRDADLLQLLEDRISKVCLFNAGGPAVNLGEEVLSLLN
jgi:GGDEF domain-containing protein